MAIDCFLMVDGIEGESTDDQHKGAINVLSFSWGEQAAAGTGHGGGRVSMQDLRFTETTNKASPKLLLACASDQRIKTAVLSCRKPGQKDDFLTITLSEVLITSFEISGSQSSDPGPTEEISLNFTKIEWEYRPQAPGGKLGSPVTAGWDLETGRPV